MPRHRLSLLAMSLLTVATFAMPRDAMAQDDDMSFDEDEGTVADPDGMTFEESEGTTVTKGREMAVVAIPSSALDQEQLDQLQSTLMATMVEVKKYDPTGPSRILPLLDENDTETCAREQLCLGAVGKEAGVSYVLMARVSKEASGFKLTVDLFDVKDKLFVRTKSYDELSSFKDVIDSVQPAVRTVFDIRAADQGPQVGTDVGRGTVQSVFAYTTAALAVACLGGGIYYGREASAQADAVVNSKKSQDNPKRYDSLTQKQARTRMQEAEGTATTANVFYGLGVVLGAASVALFVIDFGADVDEDEYTIRSLQLLPSVGPDSVGVGASLRF